MSGVPSSATLYLLSDETHARGAQLGHLAGGGGSGSGSARRRASQACAVCASAVQSARLAAGSADRADQVARRWRGTGRASGRRAAHLRGPRYTPSRFEAMPPSLISSMRIGIFSDIHANYEALQRRARGVSARRASTSTTASATPSGYGGSPNECADLVRETRQGDDPRQPRRRRRRPHGLLVLLRGRAPRARHRTPRCSRRRTWRG